MTVLRQRFIDELELRGYSPNTISSYVRSVAQLARHFNRSPDHLTDEEIKSYLLHLIRVEQCSPSTITVAVSALRFFFFHVLGRSTEAVVRALPRARPRKTRPRVYSPEQVQRLIGAEGLNLKHRTLLATAYGAGLRASEVCHLKIDDIITPRRVIRIEQSKGNKDRYVVLSPKLLEMLRTYWRAYRPTYWLFPGEPPDKPLNRISAFRVFTRAVALAGLPKLGGIHCLRHSFATHCLEMGVDVVTLKKILGHSKLATTAHYLYVSQERLEQFQSPLDRIAVNLSTSPS